MMIIIIKEKRKRKKRKIHATVQLTTQTTRPTQYIKQQLVSVRQNQTNESSPGEQIITLTESSPYQHHLMSPITVCFLIFLIYIFLQFHLNIFSFFYSFQIKLAPCLSVFHCKSSTVSYRTRTVLADQTRHGQTRDVLSLTQPSVT